MKVTSSTVDFIGSISTVVIAVASVNKGDASDVVAPILVIGAVAYYKQNQPLLTTINRYLNVCIYCTVKNWFRILVVTLPDD